MFLLSYTFFSKNDLNIFSYRAIKSLNKIAIIMVSRKLWLDLIELFLLRSVNDLGADSSNKKEDFIIKGVKLFGLDSFRKSRFIDIRVVFLQNRLNLDKDFLSTCKNMIDRYSHPVERCAFIHFFQGDAKFSRKSSSDQFIIL